MGVLKDTYDIVLDVWGKTAKRIKIKRRNLISESPLAELEARVIDLESQKKTLHAQLEREQQKSDYLNTQISHWYSQAVQHWPKVQILPPPPPPPQQDIEHSQAIQRAADIVFKHR